MEVTPGHGNHRQGKGSVRGCSKKILERHRTGVNFRSVVSDLIRPKSLELSQISQNSNIENSVFSMVLFPYLSNENDSVKSQSENGNVEQSKKPKRILCSGCGQPIGTRKTYHSLDCKFRRDERNGESNPQHNFITKYRKSSNIENTLFDVSGMLILNEQQHEWINRKLKKIFKQKITRK